MHKYFVCNETNLARLETLVEDKLSAGYLLAGSLVIDHGTSGHFTWYYQPMIKYTYEVPMYEVSISEPEDVEGDTL